MTACAAFCSARLAVAAKTFNSAIESVPPTLAAAMAVAMSAMLLVFAPVTPNVCNAASKTVKVGTGVPSAASCTTLAAAAMATSFSALSTSAPSLPSTALLSKLTSFAVAVLARIPKI